MFSDSKYSNVLTIVLIVVIIIIFALIGFLGYDVYRKYQIDKDAKDFMSHYDESIRNTVNEENNSVNNPEENQVGNLIINIGDIDNNINNNQNSGNGSSTTTKPTYKGFGVVGRIEIPKTGIDYPVLEEVTIKSLETSVAYYYGPGLNKVGNTTISGHNYRNGAFFGKNKQLTNGDIIYITDNSGTKIAYTVYKVYTTTDTDGEYLSRDTAGKREISLTTCTDDSKGRLIVWAKEQ